MSKEELIKEIVKGYHPDWEPAPEIEDVIKDINNLYNLKIDSREYFELKAKVTGYMSMNCIEQFDRGKRGQGMLTRKMLEALLFNLSEAELMGAEAR